jgi:cell division septation protein DedD
MIVGLLVGLAIALGVALYIAKVPVPFMDKVGHRTPEQEAQEAEKLKTWDPNAGLAGKQAPRPVLAASEAGSAPLPYVGGASSPVPVAVVGQARLGGQGGFRRGTRAEARSKRDPAAILSGAPVPAHADKPAEPAAAGPDPFIYFVQAGAYSNANDAEQQRARLAMQGLVAKVSEREQAGRNVYRVRLGPSTAGTKPNGSRTASRARAWIPPWCGWSAARASPEAPRPAATGALLLNKDS